jgi:hypothetical protein
MLRRSKIAACGALNRICQMALGLSVIRGEQLTKARHDVLIDR